MKRKFLATIVFFLAISLVMTVNANYSFGDGIDGYVYANGSPAAGITVHVYNATDGLEGYGVNADNSQGVLGTDVTNASGYFHIAWLYAAGHQYTVVAKTIVGDLTEEDVTVKCGATIRVYFSYSTDGDPCTPGYWKNHPEAWLIETVEIGGIAYTKTQAIALLKGNAKDATYKLASHLIAAKLNLANGVDPSSISGTISEADAFLIEHPLGTNPKGPLRDYALSLKDTLDAFNNS